VRRIIGLSYRALARLDGYARARDLDNGIGKVTHTAAGWEIPSKESLSSRRDKENDSSQEQNEQGEAESGCWILAARCWMPDAGLTGGSIPSRQFLSQAYLWRFCGLVQIAFEGLWLAKSATEHLPCN